ncbi:MHYT domain-containing protein [Sphingomonas sp. Leaf22]|uniref:MHYT domain-containing protein n=1 Tax=Sphingomonas sp. Leaf22 TaxID=1735687 RepID=UPI0009E75E64|nr:MHYT domain-containing protein [Sphingomonas sp. Leaf22]
MVLHGVHDSYLVILSTIVAIIAAFTALTLAGRVRESRDRARRVWLASAATALGGGIWSMHFVAMLAFSMPGMVVRYDLVPTLVSLALAIGFTGGGLALIDWSAPTTRRTLVAGVLIGAGVATMHYVGMAAMRMPAIVRYDPLWVAISVIVAIGAATGAVRLATRDQQVGRRAIAAVVMGMAIAGMHYSGMYAATFTQAHAPDVAAGGVTGLHPAFLATAISLVTLIVLLLALAAVQLERVLRGMARRETRVRFFSDLNDRLFVAGRATEAMTIATTALGTVLGASRCAYADVHADGDRFWIRSDYTAPEHDSSAGEYSLDRFGPDAAAALRSGSPIVLRDIAVDTGPGDGREMFHAIGINAIICCPLIKDGRLAAMMAVHQDRARRWTVEEIELVKEVADRCWVHVERIGAEARLRTSEERLRLAVDNADVGFWDVDLVADELIWPPRTKAMFGIAPDTPVTLKDFYDGLHPDDRDVTSQAFAAATDPARRAYYDVEYRSIGREDGVIRWVSAKGRGIFDDQGNCIRVAGTALEITARREAQDALRELNATLEARVDAAIRAREEAQAALRQSQKMEAMGQLTGGVAHDFNNLLTPILGSLDMLQRKGLGNERERRLIDGAVQSAERARTLVQRLLAFARRQPLQPVPVDVAALIEGMGDLVASTTGPQIRVIVDAPADLPPAKADPNQLEMAILNLAVNARDAMPDGGTLRISASRESIRTAHRANLRTGHYLRLSVADTGLGMDSETQARAIEPFFSTKGVGKGTGLGLSMVHGLASQLGGALTIQSSPGRGTNVELWLPQSATAAEAGRVPDAIAPTTASGVVLVVDDERLVRMSTAEMLSDLGYAVIEAESGEAAMRFVEEGRPFDLVVTDHLMPGISGTDLIRRIRTLRPGTPTLLVSGYADIEGLDPALPRLSKPFRKDELAAGLREAQSVRMTAEVPAGV